MALLGAAMSSPGAASAALPSNNAAIETELRKCLRDIIPPTAPKITLAHVIFVRL
jgi:hypothetical protein